METLLDECINALGKNTEIINSEKTITNLFNLLINTFPFTQWGRIDWGKIKKKFEIEDTNQTKNIIDKIPKNLSKSAYVLWNDASCPIIKTDLDNAINAIDDIIPVGFDTWLFCPESNYVIEFYHEGEITIGFSNKK